MDVSRFDIHGCLGGWPDDPGQMDPAQDYCCTTREDQISSENQNQFRLTFDTTEAMDECSKRTRYKCLAFWNFIDSEPRLSSLIKEGQYIPDMDCVEIKGEGRNQTKKQDLDANKPMPGFSGLTKAQFRALHESGRQRLQKRRELNASLEKKSGQTTFFRNRKKEKPNKLIELADVPPENPDQILLEMNKFDATIYEQK